MNNLYTYSLIRACFDSGRDYIDCFLSFVIAVANGEKSNSLASAKEAMKAAYGLDIPVHTLRTIIKRGIRQKSLVGDMNDFRSLQGIQSVLCAKEVMDATKWKIHSLVERAREYVNTALKANHDHNEVEQMISEYVYGNLADLRYFLISDAEVSPVNAGGDHTQSQGVIKSFIEEVVQSDQELLGTFHDVICGSLISAAITGIQEISEIGQKFRQTLLFLDTNVVLDALQLQDSEATTATREFLQLVKKTKMFSLRVFDFTVDEAVRVLAEYPRQQANYIKGVRVDSIYSLLKERGWTNSHVEDYILNIEDKLRSFGIQVAPSKSFEVDSKFPCLEKYKPDQGTNGKMHDLLAIENVRGIRGGNAKVRRIEHAKAFFVSQDSRLACYNYHENGHITNHTVPEVMPEYTLTNLLWLKAPKSIPLDAVISINKQHAIVNKEVWGSFHNLLSRAKEEGSDFVSDVAMLLYRDRLDDALRRVGTETNEKVIEDSVRKEAQAIAEELAKEREAQGIEARDHQRQQSAILISQLENKFNSQIEAINQRHMEKVIQARLCLRAKTDREAAIILGIVLGSFAVAAVVSLVTGFVFERWNWIEPLVYILGFVYATIWGFDIREARTKCKKAIAERLYRIRINRPEWRVLLNGSQQINVDECARPKA